MPKHKTVGNAHYTIHVPTHDPHGNELQDLSAMGHQWLYSKIPRLLHSVHAEGPHQGHPYRHLKVLALDTPETDSHVKQLANTIGQQSAHRAVFVYKDGKQGIQPWNMANKFYDAQPAQPEHMAVTPYAATVAPASYEGRP